MGKIKREEIKRTEGLKTEELSKELLEEWYAEKEKEVLPEKPEEPGEGLEERREMLSKPLPPLQGKADLKIRREEQKKISVKNKIKYLLVLGEKKGLKKAIEEAKRENDPFLLDVFHDLLAKDGVYKKFLKK